MLKHVLVFVMTLSCVCGVAAPEGVPELSPVQGIDGPGGASYPHGAVQVTDVPESSGVRGYSLYEPSLPRPSSAPLLVYMMGDLKIPIESSVASAVYAPLLRHISRKGYVVLFIGSSFPESKAHMLEGVPEQILATVRTALGRQKLRPTKPATDSAGVLWAIGGHSRGGLYGILAANRAKQFALPAPKAILLHESNTPTSVRGVCNGNPTYPLCGFEFSALTQIPSSTQLLMIRSYENEARLSGDGDPGPYALGAVKAYADLWRQTSIADASTHFFYIRRAEHGSEKVESAHVSVLSTLVPLGPKLAELFRSLLLGTVSAPDREDWLGYWRPTVATLDTAFRREGNSAQYLQENSNLATDMGKWTDGTPVPPMLTKRDFPRYFVRENFAVPRGAIAVAPLYPAAEVTRGTARDISIRNEGEMTAYVTSIDVSGDGFSASGQQSCLKAYETNSCAFQVHFEGAEPKAGAVAIKFSSNGTSTTVTRILNGIP